MATCKILFVLMLVVSCSSPQFVTQTPMDKTGSLISLIKSVASNPNYLKRCRDINPNREKTQIAYQGIRPGKTSEDEAKSLLGPPDQSFTVMNVTNWMYGDVGLYIERGIVTDVLVPANDAPAMTLEKFVRLYGCPDVIFAIDSGEEPYGNYDATRFGYHNIGLVVQFSNFPVTMNSIPEYIQYFQPMSLDDFLIKNAWDQATINFGKPVDWEDAITE